MKILANIVVPAISKNYDVLLPDFIAVKQLTEMIACSIEELSNNTYVSSGMEFLCLQETNQLLRQDWTLFQCGVQNGNHLILL